jgi:tellurite resistance protein TehA-like permease
MSSLLAWRRERLPWRLALPVTTGLALPAAWAGGDARLLLSAWPMALLLFAIFRLGDDLADRERDATRTPARVMVVGPPRPFRIALAASTLLALLALAAASWIAFTVLLLFGAVLTAGYLLARPRIRDATWRYGLLLTKYPAMVAALSCLQSAPTLDRLCAAAGAAWAGAIAYERWHTEGES